MANILVPVAILASMSAEVCVVAYNGATVQIELSAVKA